MRISYISEAVVLTLPPRQDAAIVSITEPGREAPLPCPEGWGALLRIQFADAEYDGSTIARLKARGRPFNADSKGFPCRRTTQALHAFFDALAGQTVSPTTNPFQQPQTEPREPRHRDRHPRNAGSTCRLAFALIRTGGRSRY